MTDDTMDSRRKLSTYSIEMLKIRSRLYPDSHRVADSIIGQIELLVDVIIDAAEQGAEAQFNAFKLGPEITVLTYIDDNRPATVTINHATRLVAFARGDGYIDSPYQLEVDALMEVHQSVSNLYNRLR